MINKIIEQNEILQYHFLSPLLFNYFILISAQRLYFLYAYKFLWNDLEWISNKSRSIPL